MDGSRVRYQKGPYAKRNGWLGTIVYTYDNGYRMVIQWDDASEPVDYNAKCALWCPSQGYTCNDAYVHAEGSFSE